MDAAAFGQVVGGQLDDLAIRSPRAVATRYDKREFMYQGTIDVASIRIWLRDPSHGLRN